jgi:mannose-6-phosphate isomerase
MIVYPLTCEPLVKPRIWGGRTVQRLFGLASALEGKIGEWWVVSDIPEGVTPVKGGPEAGRPLRDVVERWARRLVGDAPLVDGRFPLLIKFLDAGDRLSIQVHPDEEACRQLGGDARVKHEAWYVVSAEDGAAIYAGLRPGVTREEFSHAVGEGRVADVLERIPVRAGDCYYLPSGTVHALGAGVVVAEVQTPSDTTYRVFDWNRLGDDGHPRPLHVDQAMACIHFGEAPPIRQPRRHQADAWTTSTRLVTCPRFILDKVRAAEGFERRLGAGHLELWIILEGGGGFTTDGLADPIAFSAGECVVVPAEPEPTVVRLRADTVWLRVTVPA